jgi:nucleoside-triphosphatase
MPSSVKNVLLTGVPGCGKTTVVRRVIERLRDLRLAGFYTQELRKAGKRVGFEAVGLGGTRDPLADVETASDLRVGRYGVDLAAFETLLNAELVSPPGQVDLYVLDEVGKMECFSELFVAATKRILEGPVPVLATVAAKGSGFIAQVRSRTDAELLTVTPANRDALPEMIAERTRALVLEQAGDNSRRQSF